MKMAGLQISLSAKEDKSVKHVRTGLHQLVINRLEVQPADEGVADVFAAVAGALRRHHGRLDAGGFDHELDLAAAFQRDEPECRVFDAVAAGGEQAVVLM